MFGDKFVYVDTVSLKSVLFCFVNLSMKCKPSIPLRKGGLTLRPHYYNYYYKPLYPSTQSPAPPVKATKTPLL